MINIVMLLTICFYIIPFALIPSTLEGDIPNDSTNTNVIGMEYDVTEQVPSPNPFYDIGLFESEIDIPFIDQTSKHLSQMVPRILPLGALSMMMRYGK